jgi:hypothetical protein
VGDVDEQQFHSVEVGLKARNWDSVLVPSMIKLKEGFLYISVTM